MMLATIEYSNVACGDDSVEVLWGSPPSCFVCCNKLQTWLPKKKQSVAWLHHVEQVHDDRYGLGQLLRGNHWG